MAASWSRYELTDLSGAHLGWLGDDGLPGVVPGSCELTWSQYAAIHGTGRLTLLGSLDWDHVCIVPTRFVRVAGVTVAYQRGRYLAAGSRRTVVRAWQTVDGTPTLVSSDAAEVALYSQELRLSREPLQGPLDLPAGALYTSAVLDLLASVSITDVALTPSTATLPAPWHVEAGTSKLEAVNRLLDALGYWSIRFDNAGRAVVAPYQHPLKRPKVFDFAPDGDWYKGQVSEDSDAWDVPNVMVGTARQADDLPPLVYTARNQSAGRFSRDARGFWVGPKDTAPVQVDTPDADTLVTVMDRKLRAAGRAQRTWTVDYLWRDLVMDEVGTLRHADINTTTTLTKRVERMDSDTATATLEEVL